MLTKCDKDISKFNNIENKSLRENKYIYYICLS